MRDTHKVAKLYIEVHVNLTRKTLKKKIADAAWSSVQSGNTFEAFNQVIRLN